MATKIKRNSITVEGKTDGPPYKGLSIMQRSDHRTAKGQGQGQNLAQGQAAAGANVGRVWADDAEWP